eukprot:347179-Chlamydomonas_euryale.AAC.1
MAHMRGSGAWGPLWMHAVDGTPLRGCAHEQARAACSLPPMHAAPSPCAPPWAQAPPPYCTSSPTAPARPHPLAGSAPAAPALRPAKRPPPRQGTLPHVTVQSPHSPRSPPCLRRHQKFHRLRCRRYRPAGVSRGSRRRCMSRRRRSDHRWPFRAATGASGQHAGDRDEDLS